MHLTKAETKGLFETKVPERRSSDKTEGKSDYPMLSSPYKPEVPLTVAPMMTPEDKNREYYDRDALSVANLPPRTRGKHY